MAEIKNGLLIDGLVTQKIVSNIEHPGLDFKKIKAIIVHQTDSYNALGTIGYWEKRARILSSIAAPARRRRQN